MTAIDTLVSLMFAACVENNTVVIQYEPVEIGKTVYECPLIGNKASFTVWKRYCPDEEEFNVAVMDMRSGYTFLLRKDNSITISEPENKDFTTYYPACEVKDNESLADQKR